MKSIIRENRYFLIPLALFFIAGLILVLIIPKAELHIMSNRLNTPFLDYFFKYMTYLGDGVAIAVVVVILLFVRYRWAITLGMAGVFVLITINFLKKTVFPQFLRPSKYFEMYQSYKLHFVEGVKLHSHFSFPSGHTTAGFVLFLMLALICKKNWVKLVCFFIALLIGYSRVYISQHFFMDVVAGSLLGSAIILVFFYWTSTWKKTWLNRSILNK